MTRRNARLQKWETSFSECNFSFLNSKCPNMCLNSKWSEKFMSKNEYEFWMGVGKLSNYPPITWIPNPITIWCPIHFFLDSWTFMYKFCPRDKTTLSPSNFISFRRQIRMEEWGPLLNEDLKKLLLGIPKMIVACPLHNTTACMLVSSIPTEITFYL